MAAKSYTGAITAGTAISALPGTLQSLQVDATATSVVTIFDNASAASGTILFQQNFPASGQFYFSFFKMGGLRYANGLFAVVATAACEITANVS